MKGTRALSFLLALAMLASLVIPGSLVLPAKADTDNGMRISKTATKNEDGTYTITLEAYATGSKVISEVKSDVPADIVLVLDQSGSMEDDMGTVSFELYKDETDWWGTTYHTRNQDYYEVRHNGGSGNLWHELEDGSYVSVSVTIQETASYTELRTSLKNYTTENQYDDYYYGDLTTDCYYYYANNLYEKVGEDSYKQVTLTETRTGDWRNPTYTYTYTFSDGTSVTSTGRTEVPKLGNHAPLYYKTVDDTKTVYTYTYTDASGNVVTIGTSTGASTVFTPTLYKRNVSTSGGGSRLSALSSAVTTFANTVAEKAKGADGILGNEDDIDHRIAVVGFASGDPSDTLYHNSEVFVGADQYQYNTTASEHYTEAFQSMKTQQGQNNVIASINALDANGATYTNLGVEMANGILRTNPVPAGEKRNRVVIVFTDGVPGRTGYSSTVANSAITEANTSRTLGANVYAVGIFEGADATSAGNSGGTDTQKANWFMQNLSDNKGTPRSPSYYLSASDSGTLSSIFQQIASNIESGGTSATLGSSSVVKDIIAPSFQLPAGATADSITLETYSYTGENTWNKNTDAMGANATIIDGQVSVTGFNFSENWCGTVTENGNTTYRGNKLKISFKVVPKDGFLGGNDVPTNGTASGVYADASADTPIMAFDVPTVNVPIATPDFTVNNKTIYEGNSTAVSGLYTLPDYTGDNAWKAAYVNVTTTGTTADETVSPTVCTDYTVIVTYTPKTDGSESAASGGGTANAMAGESASKTATVHVLHPVVTAEVHDVEKYYGESYTLGNDAGGSITLDWVDKDTSHTNNPAVEGTAPYTKDDLDLEYTTTQFAGQSGTVPKNNFDVTVTVKKDSEVVTDATITTTCDISGSNCATTATDGVYTVHVKTCQLTITKSGGAAGEPYVFTVLKDGTKYSEVSIVGNSTATIVELPVGEYSIVEDQGWSWRYPNPSYGSNVTLSATNRNGTITCTNGLINQYWLNGFSTVVQNIFGVKH